MVNYKPPKDLIVDWAVKEPSRAYERAKYLPFLDVQTKRGLRDKGHILSTIWCYRKVKGLYGWSTDCKPPIK